MLAVLIDGVAFGLQLAVLGAGLTLVFGLAGILNLAHGQLVVVAAVVTSLLRGAGLPTGLAICAGVASAVVGALCMDRFLLPMAYAREGEQRAQRSLLLTLALAMIIDGLLAWRLPTTVLSLVPPIGAVEVMGVRLRGGTVVAAGVAAAILLLLIWFLRVTVTGRAIRAVSEDAIGARLCGIDTSRMRTLVVGLSGLLAGVIAVSRALGSSVGVSDGFSLTVLALIVSVVGGLGRVSGAMIAGLLLGMVHALATHLFGAYQTWVLLLVAAVVAALVRPTGWSGGRA